LKKRRSFNASRDVHLALPPTTLTHVISIADVLTPITFLCSSACTDTHMNTTNLNNNPNHHHHHRHHHRRRRRHHHHHRHRHQAFGVNLKRSEDRKSVEASNGDTERYDSTTTPSSTSTPSTSSAKRVVKTSNSKPKIRGLYWQCLVCQKTKQQQGQNTIPAKDAPPQRRMRQRKRKYSKPHTLQTQETHAHTLTHTHIYTHACGRFDGNVCDAVCIKVPELTRVVF
jgi:hypothetical protein